MLAAGGLTSVFVSFIIILRLEHSSSEEFPFSQPIQLHD